MALPHMAAAAGDSGTTMHDAAGGSDDYSSGLSQAMEGIVLEAPPGLLSTPPTAPTITVGMPQLAEFIEEAILEHFELVQAASSITHQPSEGLTLPGDWTMLHDLLKKLAFDAASAKRTAMNHRSRRL